LNLIYATILEFQNYEKIIWLLSMMKDWEKFLYTLSCSYQLSWRNFVKRPIHAEMLDLSRNFPILQPGQFLIVVTRKSQTVWSQKINHRKAEKVTYQIGIQSFRISPVSGILFLPAVVLSRTDSSSLSMHKIP
jgi:hypothetical protein